jgi:hypothetical protein
MKIIFINYIMFKLMKLICFNTKSFENNLYIPDLNNNKLLIILLFKLISLNKWIYQNKGNLKILID